MIGQPTFKYLAMAFKYFGFGAPTSKLKCPGCNKPNSSKQLLGSVEKHRQFPAVAIPKNNTLNCTVNNLIGTSWYGKLNQSQGNDSQF